MKRTKLFTIVFVALLALSALPVLAQDSPLTPNEVLVMQWVEASANPDTAATAAKTLLAPDFVFYGVTDNQIFDAARYILMDEGANYLPGVVNCVVKGEHDLVEANYGMIQPYGIQVIPRSILFRIENGQIAEAWFGHTL